MKNIIFGLIFAMVSIQTLAQVAPQSYFVEFMDKTNSSYSVNSPSQFLSYRAIERRQKQGIAIDQNDLPVNQSYINRLREYPVTILTRSKWFNGVTIYCLNPSIIDSIMKLTFVKGIHKNSNINSVNNSNPDINYNSYQVLLKFRNPQSFLTGSVYKEQFTYDYGPSLNQIRMVNGDSMHRMGYTGEGMVIAVLDGGFYHVDVLRAFDSLRLNNQILGTRDFVSPGNNVYLENEHGMEVLSCMGGNIPGQLVGTAPKADYWLLRTEDVKSEYLIEEYNWVAAAEFADSAGADIIHSSLCYTRFDEILQNHRCEDMDGNTTPVTRGANMASLKGMLVVNSAGNSGTTDWKCVGAPSDGYSVLAVAAVDSNRIRAGFSSVGETRRRIKPNVAAQGFKTIVSSTTGDIMYNNGTSFAAPIISGMAACLWQSDRTMSNQSILRAIELSGSQVSNPDSLLGYGIPDFVHALHNMKVREKQPESAVTIRPNPFQDQFSVTCHITSPQTIVISLIDLLGRTVHQVHRLSNRAGEFEITVSGLSVLPAGNYILQLSGPELQVRARLIKSL